jgi:hypothetical protein
MVKDKDYTSISKVTKIHVNTHKKLGYILYPINNKTIKTTKYIYILKKTF